MGTIVTRALKLASITLLLALSGNSQASSVYGKIGYIDRPFHVATGYNNYGHHKQINRYYHKPRHYRYNQYYRPHSRYKPHYYRSKPHHYRYGPHYYKPRYHYRSRGHYARHPAHRSQHYFTHRHRPEHYDQRYYYKKNLRNNHRYRRY